MTELGYILKQDILKEIDSNTLDELTGGRKAIGSNPAVEGKDFIWEGNRKGAIDYMLGYTRHWYDMDTETRPIYEHNGVDTFSVGDRVAGALDGDGVRPLYTCIADNTGESLTDTNFFTLGDDRNNVLVEIVCILIIYNLSRRYNPRQIPEQRQIDYDKVISDLEKIQKGRISLDIAERIDVTADDAGQELAYGDFEDVTQDSY